MVLIFCSISYRYALAAVSLGNLFMKSLYNILISLNDHLFFVEEKGNSSAILK